MRFTKSLFHTLLFSFFLFTLSGCVYLRLLEAKNQLADFERNFRVQITEDHFRLNFLKPVLLSEDFLYLTKLHPSRVEELPQGYRWYLDFRQMNTRAQPGKSIVFGMTFNRENRLSRWDFSPVFLEMAPATFLEASIRSLGKGKVDEGHRQLKVDPEDLPKVSAAPPNRKKILEVLGPPAEQSVKDGMTLYVYRFKAEAIPVGEENEKRRVAEAKLYFNPITDELIKMSSRFVGLKIAIDYRRLAQSSRPG
ncbi:hypothetical protein [Methylocaldum sp.]|uniref:hypothetical protein n=1 Tax=Methylocaldum sp. TaxID=1969727 RepID=UPI002D56D9E7|nr:hypothetical protein [Methylocaldum sp.]HYE34810.1 hypothetical protein [Methylocaldum sp.]